MRLYKFFAVALIAMGSMTFQSCLKDQVDVFEESPSQRMQATLDKAREVLVSSPEGWIFEYFPNRKLSYGGYVYTLKFDDEKVTVGSEISPGEFVSSYYKFTNDNGPMLTFDTYNKLLHYFAIPSSDAYQGMDGDFEFMIMDIQPERLTLRGKRTGNTMYLRKLTSSAEEYLKSTCEMAETLFLTSAKGKIDGVDLNADINVDNRYMEFSWGDGEADSAGGYYLPSPTGVDFVEPIDINGKIIKSIGYNPKTLTYVADGLSLTGQVAPDYSMFSEYEGDFDFIYNEGKKKVAVKLVRDVPAKKIYIKGLNENYDVVATYHPAKGRIEINSQRLCANTTTEDIWLCGWGYPESTSLNKGLKIGMYCVKDPETPGTFKFVPNDESTLKVLSFILYRVNSSGGLAGNASGLTKFYINGSYQVIQCGSLVKK